MNEINRKQIATQDRRRALLITALAVVVVFILWNVAALDFIVYPLRLFVTYVHEAGHSLMAVLTGGKIIGFLVSANGSGLATTAGGSRALILPAGYLGAALFGSGLFYLVNRFPRLGNALAGVLGAGLFLFTVLFARPDETGVPLALIIGSIFGLVLIFIALRARPLLTLLILNILAVMTALNAVLDVWQLTHYINATRGETANDAVAFSRSVTPFVPPTVIALTWALIAILMFATAVWYGVLKPLRHEISDSYDALRSR